MKRKDIENTIFTLLFIVGETLIISFLVWFILHHDEAIENLKSNVEYFITKLVECFT